MTKIQLIVAVAALGLSVGCSSNHSKNDAELATNTVEETSLIERTIAASKAIYECSGTSNGVSYLADVLSADSGNEYIKISEGRASRYFLVKGPPKKTAIYIFRDGQEVDPRSGNTLEGKASIKTPRILQNKGQLTVDGDKMDIRCKHGSIQDPHKF